MPDHTDALLERQAMTVAERARRKAFTDARDLLYGMEYEVEDVLVVADWLMDGQATLALKIAQQSADNFGHRGTREFPDAATWSRVDDDTTGAPEVSRG